MKTSTRFVIAGFALLAAAGAFGQKSADPPPALPQLADTQVRFTDQAAAIRSQMKEGGRWEFVDGNNRLTVERRLDEIADLLGSGASAGELPPKDKATLLVAQEEVNAILSRQDGRRVICQSVAQTGSHRQQLECVTYAERERARKESRLSMGDRSREAQGLIVEGPNKILERDRKGLASRWSR